MFTPKMNKVRASNPIISNTSLNESKEIHYPEELSNAVDICHKNIEFFKQTCKRASCCNLLYVKPIAPTNCDKYRKIYIENQEKLRAIALKQHERIKDASLKSVAELKELEELTVHETNLENKLANLTDSHGTITHQYIVEVEAAFKLALEQYDKWFKFKINDVSFGSNNRIVASLVFDEGPNSPFKLTFDARNYELIDFEMDFINDGNKKLVELREKIKKSNNLQKLMSDLRCTVINK